MRQTQTLGILVSLFFAVYIGVIATKAVRQIATITTYSLSSKAQGKEVSAVFPISYTYSKQSLSEKLQQPSAKHIMGTDRKGRDVAVRILFGIRISLSVGVIAVSIYVTIGIILGAFAGFFRGRIDMLIQRLIEIFMALPTLIALLVLITFIEQPSIFHIMVVMGLFRWTGGTLGPRGVLSPTQSRALSRVQSRSVSVHGALFSSISCPMLWVGARRCHLWRSRSHFDRKLTFLPGAWGY